MGLAAFVLRRVTLAALPLHRDDEGRWCRAWQEHVNGSQPGPLAWHGERHEWTPVRAAVEVISARHAPRAGNLRSELAVAAR